MTIPVFIWLRLPVHVRVLTLFVLLALVFDGESAWGWLHADGQTGLNDFNGLWSYGRLIVSGRVRDLYDVEAVTVFQHHLFPAMKGFLPFFYPPPTLFLLAPLGRLPQMAAWFLWTIVGLAAFGTACAWRSNLRTFALLILLLPAVFVEVLFGQTGLFTSALLLGGLRLVPYRPELAGVLFGLLCVKPQMGILLPVALLAAKQWRAMLTATVTAVTLCLASGIVFGFGEWPTWLRALPVADRQWHTDAWHQSQFAPTFTAALAAAHVPWLLIRTAQAILPMFSAAVIWRQFRTSWDDRAAVVLCACFFLATPHGFIYDMPALAGALLLYAVRQATTTAEQFAILFAQGIPIIGSCGHAPFVMPGIIAFLIAAMVFRQRDLRSTLPVSTMRSVGWRSSMG